MFDNLFEIDVDETLDNALESVATTLRRDFKEDPESSMSLKSMYCVFMNEDALAKYEDKFAQLKQVDKNAEKLRGHMYFHNKELAAFISVDLRSDKTWIDTLFVTKEYRGKKLSFQLLDVAVKKFHASDLKVHKDNEKAIGIFKTYGFKTYDKKGSYLYMSLRSDVDEIDNEKSTEKAYAPTKDLRTDKMKNAKTNDSGKEMIKIANESALFNPKPVAMDELLDRAQGKINKNLKTPADCDAFIKTIDIETKKFNEASNAVISATAKYNSSPKSKYDLKQYNMILAKAYSLMEGNCKALFTTNRDMFSDSLRTITKNDAKRFADYAAGLKRSVKARKELILKMS